MAWNAGLAGASTVMFCWPLSESTRLAAVTAWTSVESTGLALAAVATGTVAMPAKLPAPSAGTCEQPAPNGWSVAALPDAAAELLAAGLLVDSDALLESEPELQAVSPRASAAATARMARPRCAVRFTGGAPWSCPCDGWGQHVAGRGAAPGRSRTAGI